MNKNDERTKVKEIDEKILAELTKSLEIRKDNVDIISGEQAEKIFQKIDEKKRIIFSLFQGDFSVNEKNIGDRMQSVKPQLTFYDKIANNIISRRVEKILDRMINLDVPSSRITSVCIDRKIFIHRILSENVQESFLKRYIEEETEIEKQELER